MSSVKKVKMGPGSFDLDLIDATPQSITDHMDIDTQGFGRLVILPAPLSTSITSTAANILPLSIFTGIMRRQISRTSFRGAHVSVLLGDEDGKGQLPEVDTTATSTFATWMAALKPSSVLTAGSYNASGTTLTWTWRYGQSRLEAIQFVCDTMGYEWQVTDGMALNGDTVANLYGSTPTVVLTPFHEGADLRYTGVQAEMELEESVEDWTSKVILTEDDATHETATIGSVPFQDGLGADYSWKRYIDGSSTIDAGTGATVAAQQLGRFDQVDQRLTIRTTQRAIMSLITCGQNVYAWHPAKNIYDVTTQIYYRGRIAWPMTLPVQAITMPLERGMGVYWIKNGSSPAVINLTDYVDWSGPGATIEVGAPIRKVAPVLIQRGTRGLVRQGFRS